MKGKVMQEQELLRVAQEIERRIQALSTGRKMLSTRAKTKAVAISNYEKALTIVIIKLKNGVAFELEGNTIKNPIASITEKIAKGICWKEKLGMEQAEGEYKAAIVGMQAIQAELCGFQSIYKHLDEL